VLRQPGDLVILLPCLHDMGDPAGAAAHMRQALKPDGRSLSVAKDFSS
jgi:hypothetical protein